jgi:hypothetical protein
MVTNVHDLKLGQAELSIISYKLALFPVWVGGYTYKGERNVLVINGDSGVVQGDLPRSGIGKLLGGLFGEQGD